MRTAGWSGGKPQFLRAFYAKYYTYLSVNEKTYLAKRLIYNTFQPAILCACIYSIYQCKRTKGQKDKQALFVRHLQEPAYINRT